MGLPIYNFPLPEPIPQGLRIPDTVYERPIETVSYIDWKILGPVFALIATYIFIGFVFSAVVLEDHSPRTRVLLGMAWPLVIIFGVLFAIYWCVYKFYRMVVLNTDD